jgi:2-oxoglutarate/2-oxoacid ferredoxin oxidoreductase subunit beta
MNLSQPTLTAKDFDTDQEVRWCPSCGDYAILAQLKQVLAELGLPRERFVFVSGIGCSSRLPYYLNTFGFHTLPGRAPAIATGLKSARPDLSVWVVTGDGDGLGQGLNSLLHALRRNADIKVLLFNNEVHALSKGQFSPTSRLGTRTRSSPHGSAEQPLRPLELALTAGATFVARTIDVDGEHLAETLRRAALHRGAAFVEIYQNCKIFNDGVFEYATDRSTKADSTLYLEHDRPLIFGKDRTCAISFEGLEPRIVEIDRNTAADGLPRHNEQAERSTQSQLLASLTMPDFPECLGVFRSVERPTFDSTLGAKGPRLSSGGSVEELFASDDTWQVE